MDTAPPILKPLPTGPITGPQRLALWQAARKQLRAKLDPEELRRMRETWSWA